MWAGLLAAGGFTGAPDPLQGRRGMFAVMSSASNPDDLIDGLGEKWQIFDNGVKPYACGVVIHPAIDAVRDLAARKGLDSGPDFVDHAAGAPVGTRTDRKDRSQNGFGRQVLGDLRVLDRTAAWPCRGGRVLRRPRRRSRRARRDVPHRGRRGCRRAPHPGRCNGGHHRRRYGRDVGRRRAGNPGQ